MFRNEEGRVPDEPSIRVVAFVPAPAHDRDRGLLGWLVLDFDGLLLIDGVTLRRTLDGSLALAFPAPRDARGRRRAPVRPLDDPARRAIEAAVFKALDVAPDGEPDLQALRARAPEVAGAEDAGGRS